MHNLLTQIPAKRLLAITPSDVTVFSKPLSGVYVGSPGNVTALAEDDTTPVLFLAVPAGTVLPVAAIKIMATGTTATSLVGLYQ